MKINGAYKFRTKANVFPSLKICFLGQYQDRVSGDTNFSFFIATPDNEVEEIIIENPYSGGFFGYEIEDIYFQNVGNKKADWVSTIKCKWNTSSILEESQLKVLLSYKVGESVTNEKAKEYINVETDEQYLINTIDRQRHNALMPIGCGDFAGDKPPFFMKTERSPTQYLVNDEIIFTASNSITDSPTSLVQTNATSFLNPSLYYYFYNNTVGLIEDLIPQTCSGSSIYSRTDNKTTRVRTIIDSSSITNGFSVYNFMDSSLPPIYFGGSGDVDYYSTPRIYDPSACRGFKGKYYLSSEVSLESSISASQSQSRSFSYSYGFGSNVRNGNLTVFTEWELKIYSIYLTRNLTSSFLFESNYSYTASENMVTLTYPETGTFELSDNAIHSTSIYLISLETGEKTKVCEYQITRNNTVNYITNNMSGPGAGGFNYVLSNWFWSNPSSIKSISYAKKIGATYDGDPIGGVYSSASSIEEDALFLFLKAIQRRGKSVLKGDYLYYIENDFFDPSNLFLNQEYTLSLLVFNIKDINNYQKKEIKFKPSKLPERMENLTISKILAIQYIE